MTGTVFQSDHSAPAGGRSVGQGAYLSTALAIRIVREVGQAVVGVVVAAEVVVVGTRVVVLGRVARAATPAPAVSLCESALPQECVQYPI